MENDLSREPMMDMYIFETLQLIEQLETLVLDTEKNKNYETSDINEIFRIMHTIKGSSSMMLFNNIASLAHTLEDLFHFLREEKIQDFDFYPLTDIVLEGIDFIKDEVGKLEDGAESDGDASNIIKSAESYLASLRKHNPDKSMLDNREADKEQKYYIPKANNLEKQEVSLYKALITFESGCEMENIRAFTVVHNLKQITEEIHHYPEDIASNSAESVIKSDGFRLFFKSSKSYDEMHSFFMETIFLSHLELEIISNEQYEDETNPDDSFSDNVEEINSTRDEGKNQVNTKNHTGTQNLLSVNINKLDKLLDMVGELVIAESMVTQNPEVKGLNIESFQKSTRHLKKITSEIQDIVMSLRMVPISSTFQKMNRIVRDMSKKLQKEVYLEIIGEETEVDKNIIDRISDPLMHLIRNSIDHGLESAAERRSKGKTETGKVTLEARNVGGDVLIIVKDDGKGLDRGKILARARENGLVNRPENELTDRDIYSYIFLPGFSTKDKVTEFSGRGVGMDVVTRNIGTVGGSVSVDSTAGEGTTIVLKIPLTLAIMDGMSIRVGNSIYTIPTMDIRESFRAKEGDVITDPDGNEMIMIRGQCYPILRMHELYKVKTKVTNIPNGIIVMVENEDKGLCIFADELLGEQQVVVKALPNYIKNFKKVKGVAGCTLFGDGSISLILDVAEIINH